MRAYFNDGGVYNRRVFLGDKTMKPISDDMEELLHLMQRFELLVKAILNKVDEIMKREADNEN